MFDPSVFIIMLKTTKVEIHKRRKRRMRGRLLQKDFRKLSTVNPSGIIIMSKII